MENNENLENVTLSKFDVLGGIVFAIGLSLIAGKFFEYISMPYGFGALIVLVGLTLLFIGVLKSSNKNKFNNSIKNN